MTRDLKLPSGEPAADDWLSIYGAVHRVMTRKGVPLGPAIRLLEDAVRSREIRVAKSAPTWERPERRPEGVSLDELQRFKLNPQGTGVVTVGLHTPPWRYFVSEIDLQYWLDQQGEAVTTAPALPEEPTKGERKGGRGRVYDRDNFYREVIRIANFDGLPLDGPPRDDQIKLTNMMMDWCDREWGGAPERRTVSGWVSEIYSTSGNHGSRHSYFLFVPITSCLERLRVHLTARLRLQ